MIRNSLLVAALAVLLSLGLHLTGLVVLFEPGSRPEEAAEQPPADSAAFEDFAEEALEPEAPEPTPEVEPEELVEPEPITDAQVAAETPQDTVAPDSGTETQNEGRIEPDEVQGAEPPATALTAEAPEGTPEAVPEATEVEAEETQEVIESTEADVPEEAAETPPTELALEALEDEGVIEAPEEEVTEPEEQVLASAVTRSVRPPTTRPTEETPGQEDAAEEIDDVQSFAAELAETQRTGIDLLAEAGTAALYGRESLSRARATGNALDTNYAGEVLMRLNRALRVHKNERGSALIRFQILPDGSVGWVRIIRSRGTPGIQVAAAANVRSAAPFPRPPDGKPVELGFTFQSR